jgi:hypothetical protein
MKTTKNIIVTAAFALIAAFSFANNKPLAVKSENAQIQSYLEKLEFNKVVKSTADVNIHFMINDMNEIVVMNTTNENLDAIIKSGLNYKQVNVTNLERNVLYIMPVLVVVKN